MWQTPRIFSHWTKKRIKDTNKSLKKKKKAINWQKLKWLQYHAPKRMWEKDNTYLLLEREHTGTTLLATLDETYALWSVISAPGADSCVYENMYKNVQGSTVLIVKY